MIKIQARVRRSFILAYGKNPLKRKALALLLFLKANGIDAVRNFSYNKLHALSHVHVSTLKKRIPILIEEGLAHMEASHLILNKPYARNKTRNIVADSSNYKTLTDFEHLVATLCVANAIRRKEYVRSLYETLETSHDLKEIKEARKYVQRRGNGYTYKEYGFSYAYFARKLRVSVKTAFSIIKKAVNNGILNKFNNIKLYHKGGGRSFVPSIHNRLFAYGDNVYYACANTYTLASCA